VTGIVSFELVAVGRITLRLAQADAEHQDDCFIVCEFQQSFVQEAHCTEWDNIPAFLGRSDPRSEIREPTAGSRRVCRIIAIGRPPRGTDTGTQISSSRVVCLGTKLNLP
jgi:hypothetical protein